MKIAEKTSMIEPGNSNLDRTIKPGISKLDRTLYFISTLASMHKSIDSAIELKEKYQMLLFEPSLLFRYRKDWIPFLLAVRLYNILRMPDGTGRNVLNNFLGNIEKYDPELAKEIRGIIETSSRHNILFEDLTAALRHGRDYFVSYISTHSKDLIERAKSLKDKDPKLSKQLVELFTAISGHEIDYLIRYRQDCENWLHYAVGYDIGFFINRISLFLNGGFDNSSKEQFQGLDKNFGDEKIQGIILRNNAVRNLGSYLNQLKYLNLLIAMCRRAYVSGDWNEGFFGPKGFWTNFEKYARDFERVYGNVDFKERLIATERKKEYELPQFWGGVWERSETQDINAIRQQGILYIVEGGVIYIIRQDGVLTKLLSELYSRRYQVNKVIHPAAAALMKIFEGRENELKAARNQSVRDLIRLLIGARVKSNIPRLLRKILKRKRKALIKKLKEDIAGLERLLLASFPEYFDYLQELWQVTKKIDSDLIDKFLDRTYRLAMANLDFARRQVNKDKFLQDLRTGTLVMGADVAAQETWLRRLRMLNCDHLSEKDLERMGLLLVQARQIAEKLRSLYNYLVQKISGDYAINIDDVRKPDWKNIANRNFELKFVARATMRII